MITRVVFEFSVAGGVFPGLADDVIGRRRRPPPPMPPATPGRIIAVPSKRRVAAFQCWKGTIDPTTGCAVDGQGQWEQAPLGDVPSELLMALAGLLAGVPQPGKPMFMETRVETHHIGDNERGETLTIKLGRITGEPFEAALPGALLGGGRDARALVSLAAALGVVQDIKAPGWTDAIHDACIKAIGDLKQRSDAARDAARKSEGRAVEAGPCTGEPFEATNIAWRSTQFGDDVDRIKQLEAQVDALDQHRKDASRNAVILREIAERLGVSIPPCSADEWSMKARQTIIDALPAHELAKRNAQAAAERIKYLEAKLPPSQRVPDPGPCTEHAHNYLSGFATCQCGQATRTGDCRGWKTEARGSEVPPMVTKLRDLQEWLERIRSALGVEHYSLSIKAIAQLVAMRDQAQQREIWATDALREVADRLGVIAPGGPEWLKIIRDQCVAKYEAARKAEGLAVDALRTVSEAFQAVREHMGVFFIPSGPGWAEQTRDACAVAFNQVKADLAAARSDVLGLTKQVGAATYAHEALIKALGYAPGTVPWSRCLELVRETITQRNEARQEAASLASKMFDARKEVDGLRKARAYERNALHQVARALSVAPEADSTDTMDDCLKAIDRMRHLRMDAEAENRGLREKDSAIAEILTDVQKRAVMNRAARLDDTLVFAIAEGQAHYSASPHDAIRHATALAFEVRGHRASQGDQGIEGNADCWREGKRRAESALDAIREHLSIRREDLSSPWVDSAKDQIIRIIDGLREIDHKATESAVAATKWEIRTRLSKALIGSIEWSLDHSMSELERVALLVRDAANGLVVGGRLEGLMNCAQFLATRAQAAHDAHQVAVTTIEQIRTLVDAGADRDTVTAVREALAKGAGNAAIVAAIDRLTASQAEGVALLKRVHSTMLVPVEEVTTEADFLAVASQNRNRHSGWNPQPKEVEPMPDALPPHDHVGGLRIPLPHGIILRLGNPSEGRFLIKRDGDKPVTFKVRCLRCNLWHPGPTQDPLGTADHHLHDAHSEKRTWWGWMDATENDWKKVEPSCEPLE